MMENGELLDHLPPTPPPPPVMTKRHAVELVLTDQPRIPEKEGIALVKERYGIDVPAGSWGAFKSIIRRQREKKTGIAHRRRRAPLPGEASLECLVNLKGELRDYPGGTDGFQNDWSRVKRVADKVGGFDALEGLLLYMSKLGI